MPGTGGDKPHTLLWTGIYRAKVIDDKDPEKRGRVKIWCPDTMPEVPDTKGIWARPANNPLGGRNSREDEIDHYFQGTCFIPPNGSWIYIFFEYGSPNQPRYLASAEIGNSKVPIECQQGSEYQKKWILFKSRWGRCVIVSDDPHDARVEITGKKRKLLNPANKPDPSGNPESVYEVDDNQTVILLDERPGKEKILLKDHKGNFINFNIEKNELHIDFKGDVHFNTGGNFYFSAAKDIHFTSGQSTFINSIDDTHIYSKGVYIEAGIDINILAGGSAYYEAVGGVLNVKASNNVLLDGSMFLAQQGAANSASPSDTATVPNTDGERDDPTTTQGDRDPELQNPITLPNTIVYDSRPENLNRKV